MIAGCRSGNTAAFTRMCETDAYAGPDGELAEEFDCNAWDNNFFEADKCVLKWYDTGTNTIVTNSTIRNCNPYSWDPDTW